jgi:RecJ-like exonuclease
VSHENPPSWLVVWQRDSDPLEVYTFHDETEARKFYEQAATSWCEVYLCRVEEAPGLRAKKLDEARGLFPLAATDMDYDVCSGCDGRGFIRVSTGHGNMEEVACPDCIPGEDGWGTGRKKHVEKDRRPSVTVSKGPSCPDCRGTGKIEVSELVAELRKGSWDAISDQCHKCHGTGELPFKPCPGCGGSGRRVLPFGADGACTVCSGSGRLGGRPATPRDAHAVRKCDSCSGTGNIEHAGRTWKCRACMGVGRV